MGAPLEAGYAPGDATAASTPPRRGAGRVTEPPREAALYPAVKRFLTARGYEAKGEVGGCDVVGVKPGEPPLVVIAELKLGFTLDLVLQGVERLAGADEVWLAVPLTRKGRDRDARARKLCRLLGFGLLAVDLGRGKAEPLVEPAPYRPRPDLRRRRALVSEHGKRRGDPSPGGAQGPVMTAYRQEALACAAAVRAGPRRPRDLAPEAPRAAAILHRNVYGWFRRVERGWYGLTETGEAALRRWGADGNGAGPADVAQAAARATSPRRRKG